MANDNGTDNRVTEWVRWTARIWGGVVFLLAMLIFASNVWGWVTNGTADPYAVGDYPPIENVPPLLMLVGAVGSAIAWRWGGLGGAITVASQLAVLPILLIHWPIQEGFPRYLACCSWRVGGGREGRGALRPARRLWQAGPWSSLRHHRSARWDSGEG